MTCARTSNGPQLHQPMGYVTLAQVRFAAKPMTKRLDVRFFSRSAHCSAWLYLPESSTPRPVIVMAHGLGATKSMRLDAYAERFRAAGYACLVFDYRHFGESEGSPRQLLDIQRQLQDWKAAMSFVRDRKDVDGTKPILWGTSFAGGHVLEIAADDRQVRAVISQCPFTDGVASCLAMEPLNALKLSALASRDQLGAWLGAEPVMVTTAGRPGTTALMTAPDAEPGYLQLVPDIDKGGFQNQVAARIVFQIMRARPGRRTPRISCPVLFCICEADSVAPAKATLRHARRAPRGEIKLYDDGHFAIYVGEPFERVIVDQLEFLRRIVPIA